MIIIILYKRRAIYFSKRHEGNLNDKYYFFFGIPLMLTSICNFSLTTIIRYRLQMNRLEDKFALNAVTK